MRAVFAVLIGATLALRLGLTQAQAPLLDEVHTISASAVPVEATFDIAVAGTYNIELTDLGTAYKPPLGPAPLASLELAVTLDHSVVAVLSETGSATGTANTHFNATVGTYTLHVIGRLGTSAASGPVGILITNVADGSTVYSLASNLAPSPTAIPADTAVLNDAFTVATPGKYDVGLADLQLPQSLSTLTLVILQPGASTPAATLSAAGSTSFTAQAGKYLVFVIAQTAAAMSTAAVNAGLFSVNVSADAGGASVYSHTAPVGIVQNLGVVSLSTGPQTLTLSDFAFPRALAQIGAVVSLQGQVVARATASGNTSFSAIAGRFDIFALPVAAASAGTGAYGVVLGPSGGTPLFTAAQVAGTPSGGTLAYSYPIQVSTAGAYQLRAADFMFPTALNSLSFAAIQGGKLLGQGSASSIDLALDAGALFVLVNAKPGTTSSGLFGIDLTPSAGGAVAFETTQGVGALFAARQVSVTAAGTYAVTVQDLGFPTTFANLDAVVTQGTDLVGSIYGGGTFNFQATPGNYYVNFIAEPDPTQKAGTYAIEVATAPPAPVVSLSVDPSAVSSGSTVTLTWSSTGATSCTASGGWTGSRATSGSAQSGALTSNTTFTLTCQGASGSGTNSVTVGITASHSGGGQLDPLYLALLLAGLAVRARFAAPEREQCDGHLDRALRDPRMGPM